MATTLAQWASGEPLLAVKLNGINNNITQDIIGVENSIQDLDDDTASIVELILGNGVISGLQISGVGGLDIEVPVGKAIVNGRFSEVGTTTTFSVPANSTIKIYLNEDSTGEYTSSTIPVDTLHLATVTTNSTDITSLVDERKMAITITDLNNSILTNISNINTNSDNISANANNISTNAEDISTNASDISILQTDVSNLTPTAVGGQEVILSLEPGATTTVEIVHITFTIPAYPEITTPTSNATIKVLSNNGDEFGNGKFTIEVTNNDAASQDITIDWTRSGI